MPWAHVFLVLNNLLRNDLQAVNEMRVSATWDKYLALSMIIRVGHGGLGEGRAVSSSKRVFITSTRPNLTLVLLALAFPGGTLFLRLASLAVRVAGRSPSGCHGHTETFSSPSAIPKTYASASDSIIPKYALKHGPVTPVTLQRTWNVLTRGFVTASMDQARMWNVCDWRFRFAAPLVIA